MQMPILQTVQPIATLAKRFLQVLKGSGICNVCWAKISCHKVNIPKQTSSLFLDVLEEKDEGVHGMLTFLLEGVLLLALPESVSVVLMGWACTPVSRGDAGLLFGGTLVTCWTS